ncbi:MAG: glycoside hydrolase family 127 protein [Candidatus Limiplasma sp.]|nr:glycoside hydrolase family 127 protein [Candidatus Limiplasma sp.]
MVTNSVFSRLSLRQVRPEGWLKRQLQIQMEGLSGKLYDLWDSVGSYSGWLGGSGESWERAPYYLDGMLPLAWYLEDEEHLALCRRFIDWTLGSQTPDGNFGPYKTADDYWSRYAMLKVLAQWAEIADDSRVLPFMERYFTYIASEVDRRPPENWSKSRIPDLLYCMKWALENGGNPGIARQAEKLDRAGSDWVEYMACLPFPRPAKYYIGWDQLNRMNYNEFDRLARYHDTHIVNVAMGLKHPAMRYAFTGDEHCKEALHKGLGDLKHYHGVPSGCMNGDEHLAGSDPNQGAELCSVVEAMFSMTASMEVFGESTLADDMERLAYNALPATITEDFMGHQYLQQANQVKCTDEKRPWFNSYNDANIFGLEPNFGCCTANMHQGWPKMLNALWFRQGSDGLVSMVLAPSTVSIPMGGQTLSIRLDTDYPFRDTLTYHVLKAPDTEVTLKLRIPGWCDAPAIDGKEVQPVDGFVALRRILHAGDTVTVTLPMTVRTSRWFHNSIAVERGPLVYGLKIKEIWRPYWQAAGVTDYQVYPDSDWNFALPEKPEVQVTESAVSDIPFSKAYPPVRLKVAARPVPSWQLDAGNAATLPQSPILCDSPDVQVELVPFGCTTLRISEFPVYQQRR